MGIRGLETFICDHGISQTISIADEIEKWRHERGMKPTIIVNLKQFVRVVVKIDEGGTILGGRLDQINEIFEFFFDAIKPHASLVFFAALNHYDVSRFLQIDYAYNYITHHHSLKDHLTKLRRKNGWQLCQNKTLRPNERLQYNLMKIAQNYGNVIANYRLAEGAILQYARQNHDKVLALMTRNTGYFALNGDFEYWNVSEIDWRQITIAKICRQKLHEYFPLNRQEMQLLCALSRIKGKVSDCIPYIKRQICGPNGYEASKLTGAITDTQREDIQDQLDNLIFNDNYAGSWDEDVYDFIAVLISNDANFKAVLQFCQSNIHFAYKLMNETITVQKDLLFIDWRRPDSNFLDMIAKVTLKLCGIIFKDVDTAKRPKTRTVYLNIDQTTKPIEKDIIYSTIPESLPSLKDLVIEEDDEQFNDARWSVFQWLVDLGAESIQKVNESSDSKYIRLVRFTLELLLKNELISTHDADIIMQTDSDAQSKGNVYKPKRYCPPPPLPNDHFPAYIDIDWVVTAHKYTIAFELVCHCLELCGLRKEMTLILFNSLKFHENMYKAQNNNMQREMHHLRLH